MKRAREAERQPMKGNFKTDFHKAMIAEWGDTESEAEIVVPVEEETANLCLMASHHSKVEASKEKEVLVRGNNSWYLDSGCSKHMTGDKSRFLSLETYDAGTVMKQPKSALTI
ncbi:uncharacterized protein LOC130797504 [Amaranthus tricolor]|uniref:uncharacterized protein LOC130797504 n=1 Tax=Amaranthus tricolor TaxID=29722 RepID=UPI00258D3F7E|nr:uncharacterized protein LOC130797504 [Amaranthus tricolor]